MEGKCSGKRWEQFRKLFDKKSSSDFHRQTFEKHSIKKGAAFGTYEVSMHVSVCGERHAADAALEGSLAGVNQHVPI